VTIYQIEPLGPWTRPVTKHRAPSRRFSASWQDTLDLLGREIGRLGRRRRERDRGPAVTTPPELIAIEEREASARIRAARAARAADTGWNWRASIANQHKAPVPAGMEWVRYCTPGIRPSQRVRWWAE
jgi:hypothetical protein